MPNVVKYTTDALPSNCLKKGNFAIGNNTGDYGLTFYNGITPPSGGYTIYLNKASGGPSIYCPTNDSQLITITNQIASANYTTAAQCLNYFAGQSDKICVNRDYEGIVTNGLVLNLDAGFIPSYPTTGTTWYDIGPNILNGTLTNGPTFNTESLGSIVFDGTNDYVTLGSLSTVNNIPQLTISSWFRASTLTPGVNGWSPIFSKRQSLTAFRPATEIIFGDSDNGLVPSQLFIRINTAAADSYCFSPVGTVSTNIWYNVVMVYNGNAITNSDKINLYVQGILTSLTFGGSNIPSTTSNPADDARIGGMLFSAQPRYFNGRVSQTQIYNRALSASEILQNYNAQKGRYGL